MGSWFKPALLSTPLSNMAANSTVMYSGLNPDSRNSSKVLRAPGGGSSDIFGLNEAHDESKDKAQEAIDQPTDADESPDNEEAAENDPVEEGSTVEESNQTALPEAPAEPPVQTPSPPVAGVRGRIPPGGHSSGSFW